LTKSTKLINELFDNYISNYLTSYGSPYLTQVTIAYWRLPSEIACWVSPIGLILDPFSQCYSPGLQFHRHLSVDPISREWSHCHCRRLPVCLECSERL